MFEELRRRWWLILLGVVVVLLLFGQQLATVYTDILWYDSIGYLHVFWTLLGTRFGLGLVGGLVVAVLVGANLLVARRLTPAYRIPSSQEEGIERFRAQLDPFVRPLVIAAALLFGLLFGLSMAAEWDTYLLWANATEFGQADPQFGRDLGFFVFTLPFYNLVNSWLFTALLVAVVLTGLAHYLFGGVRPQAEGQRVTPQAAVHFSILLAAVVAVRAWGFWLDRYMLSFSERGTVTGLSYTDVNAELVALQLLTVISAVVVVLFLTNIRFRSWLVPSAGLVILIVAAVVLAGIYPAIIQRLQVEPQELTRERPFIERNLEMTRFAYGLTFGEDVDLERFAAESELSAEDITENSRTLDSIRLWDPGTLQTTYSQLQQLRTYYSFEDVDVDRYQFEDEQKQVMLSVRELDEDDLPARAQNWQNRRLFYTHGFGLVSSDVSLKDSGGQPVFFAKDVPMSGVEEFTDKLDNPRVYFGEDSPQYSIVASNEPELDFPREEEDEDDATYEYTGDGGVSVGSFTTRAAFAARYAEPNFVLSDLINAESRVLFNRDVRDRVRDVAPFLQLDHDPYPVAVDGRIKYVQDAYVTTDMIPYSERVDLGPHTLAAQREVVPTTGPDGEVTLEERVRQRPGLTGQANYIRNSVKAVVDAYDGSVELYVVEPDDPLINAWGNAFPDTLTPLSEASEELQRHFRYPEDMFRVQASLFEAYHIREADEFFSKQDEWDTPPDVAASMNEAGGAGGERAGQEMRPYYLLMRLPGLESEEFSLIQPFTPVNRPNLSGWLAGRSDGENYGQLKAFTMPAERTVLGPSQVQARINQNDTISEQVSLWNQSGSRVIYGNLLVIPVADSMLYAQPVFLRSEQGDIPELRRVILVFGEQVVWGNTLSDAIVSMFGEGAAQRIDLPEGAGEDDVIIEDLGELEGADGEGDGARIDPEVAQLINDALAEFQAAEEALADGDLGEYQERTEEANNLLSEAQQRMEGQDPEAGDGGSADGGDGGDGDAGGGDDGDGGDGGGS